MINSEYIREWRPEHPWFTESMVEQELLISRTLVAIFSDSFLKERLAFRGGTALHKLYLRPQPRYSEDIDLVQIQAGPIKEILDHLREALSYMPEPRVKPTRINNTLLYRYESEIDPVEKMRLKVEVNGREHFHVLPWRVIPFTVRNGWFTGSSDVLTYELEELLGTKMRALYQRRKGRDLFDLDYALLHADIDAARLVECFCHYMYVSSGKIPTQRQFEMGMQEKLANVDYLADIPSIVLPSVAFNAEEAFGRVHEMLISRVDVARKAFLRTRA